MINRQSMRGTATKIPTKATTKATPAATTKTTTKTSQTKRGKGTAPAGKEGGDRGNNLRMPGWHGDEVLSASSPALPSAAEEGAARAEGNGVIRADALEREPAQGTYLARGPARRPRANDGDADENNEEKRQEAVEEHAEMPSRKFPYGKL